MNDHSKDSQTRYLKETAIALAREGFQTDRTHTDRLCMRIPMMTVSWRRTELLSPFISTILRALQVLTMQFFLLQLLLKNLASMLLLMQ